MHKSTQNNQRNEQFTFSPLKQHNLSMPLIIPQLQSNKEFKALQAKNQMLQEQIRDLKYRNEKLKKQQQIWDQIQTNVKAYESVDTQTILAQYQNKEKVLNQRIAKLNDQVVCLLSNRHLLQKENEELKQKIADFKYHNQQLKSLNQKLTTIHKKQIQMIQKDKEFDQERKFSMIGSSVIKSSSITPLSFQELKKEKLILQGKLDQCKQIVKQMQQYYASEMASLKQQIEAYQNQISCLKGQMKIKDEDIQIQKQNFRRSQASFQMILEKIEAQKSRAKQQEQFSTLIKSQNKDKKWEIIVEKMKDSYERQIFNLKDKIKFLVIKLQSLEESQDLHQQHMVPNNSMKFDLDRQHFEDNQGFGQTYANSMLTQSKMTKYNQAKQSQRGFSQCFKFTPIHSPNTSFSSSVKESLTKRQINNMTSSGNIKTPNKQTRSIKHPVLHQKTNY